MDKKSLEKSLKKLSIIKYLLLFIGVLFFSGCTFPGMYMTEHDEFTPTLNAQNQAQKANLIPITPQLILQQRHQRQAYEKKFKYNYKKPKGFSASAKGYDYLIGNQDVVSIKVWDYNSLTAQSTLVNDVNDTRLSGFTVNSEGEIFYPYIGYVKIVGLTVSQARDLITEKLSKYLKDPQVTVQIIDFQSQKINVMGAVREPKMIPVTNVPITVLDAVNAAGGPLRCGNALTNSTDNQQTVCADTRHVVVKQNGATSIINLDTLRSPVNTSENWILEKGSIVYVPDNRLYQVYVIGQTKKTGVFNMLDDRMSLRDAIVAAGGVTSESEPEYTYVIRNYKNIPEVYSINLKSPDALLLAAEFDLMPHDIVFVATSKIANVGQVIGYVAPILSLGISTAALAISIGG
ncbi:MAG: polysaccharide biosynthesis/export family protein [Gammaproteobacteria bacterium]|nr:MAG: polysaccharide biosynthesis/export family protein [Gammaproteobacteria bacterium]